MPQTASTLSLRNLHEVFGEIDPVRRRAAIDEIFHEDAVFYEPNGAYRGRDEIDRIAGVIKATHPDFQYQPLSPPEEIRRWLSGPVGVGQPWQAASLRRNRFPHRAGRQNCRPLSLLRQAPRLNVAAATWLAPPQPY